MKNNDESSNKLDETQLSTNLPERDQVERNVVSLGWVAFFGGLAQDMIQPILPTFYTSVLGLNKEFIGLIEGSLTTVVSLMKIGAGYLSDLLGVRKIIVFIGYAFSAISRFCLGLVNGDFAVFGVRLTDGVGKGLKDAPRDALVAGSAGRKKLGLAFGIQRTLDTLGSVAGPLIAYGLLRFWADHPNKYREIFMVAGLIAFIPLIIIGFWVKERKQPVNKVSISLKSLRGPFAGFLIIMLLFTLGNSSDAFLILRAEDTGISSTTVPLVVALFNLISALTAIPAGKLSDRIGRRRAITIGWGIYALTYFGFAVAKQPWMIWILYSFYGLYYAFTEGSAKALVAELVPEANRGSAYGLFNASIGVMALPASVIAGFLWNLSSGAPFLFGGLMAFLAFIAMQFLPKKVEA
jgi:MFS family permease